MTGTSPSQRHVVLSWRRAQNGSNDSNAVSLQWTVCARSPATWVGSWLHTWKSTAESWSQSQWKRTRTDGPQSTEPWWWPPAECKVELITPPNLVWFHMWEGTGIVNKWRSGSGAYFVFLFRLCNHVDGTGICSQAHHYQCGSRDGHHGKTQVSVSLQYCLLSFFFFFNCRLYTACFKDFWTTCEMWSRHVLHISKPNMSSLILLFNFCRFRGLQSVLSSPNKEKSNFWFLKPLSPCHL